MHSHETKDVVKVKKYFYVLRPILACDWIRQHNTMPPIVFQQLLDSQLTDAGLLAIIQALLDRKTKGEEFNESPKIQLLNNFLEDKISFYNHYLKTSTNIHPPEYSKLDALFKQTLEEAWSN